MKFKNRFLAIFICISLAGLSSCQQKKTEFAHTNALINETSPYLLQHAHNPVNWVSWSQDAFAKAKKEDKLVVISIGYSSCHWCHVMEKETFEDTTVARLMNKNFLSIKVDREERPDVDHVYMTAAQLMTGQGGWPLNIIALPSGKPIYAGTYHTNTGWQKILTQISKAYHEDPKSAKDFADKVAEGIQQANLFADPDAEADFTNSLIAEAVKKDADNWDELYGGYKGQQKFPLPANLAFLMDYALLDGDASAKAYLKNTIDHIVNGGIYDHLGGGFFRYSTDPMWKVPHFEKMLYDNAQLISILSKAYQVFKEPAYKKAVYESIDFLERKMKNADGGYYSAIDADSEGEEGKYYIWKKEELKEMMGDDFDLFSAYFTIKPAQAFEENKYVLYKTESDSAFAKAHALSIDQLKKKQENWKQKMAQVREKRTFPRIDDKIITSWNALTISALVDAYEAFGESKFLDLAVADYDFLQEHLVDSGSLLHSYKKGGKKNMAFLDDYSFLAAASLKLYGATTAISYLNFATTTTDTGLNLFTDSTTTLLQYGSKDRLISKIIKVDDGVIPSGNAVMAQNLFTLWHIRGTAAYLEKSRAMLAAVAPMLLENTSGYASWGGLYLNYAHNFYEIAVVGDAAQNRIAELGQSKYLPNVLITGSTVKSELPLFEGRFVTNKTLIYVCENRACKMPVATIDEAFDQLNEF